MSFRLSPRRLGKIAALLAALVAGTVCGVQLARVAGDTATSAVAAEKPNVDWSQWGGSPDRNNTPEGVNVPTEWETGEFDYQTGDWDPTDAKNIKWVAKLGSQSYGNATVHHGKVFVGTNNSAGWLKRYPANVDLGCLLCFDIENGEFLWQHSSEKLPTGRVHDWPLQGICCAPYCEGDRLWFVTSRGEVRCLDIEGFRDGENDGPVQEELLRVLDVAATDQIDSGKVDEKGKPIMVPLIPLIVAGLEKGEIIDHFQQQLESRGEGPAGKIAIVAGKQPKSWKMTGKFNGVDRALDVAVSGPTLSVFKTLQLEDKTEADVVWVYDMMAEMGISQHNMCSCSITCVGDVLFVCTSNGVDVEHNYIPAPEAPSFFAMDKNTGKVLWTDNSPRDNIHHGQWSSPTYGVINGQAQVLFGGGDGWLYSFDPAGDGQGHSKLLWKFDTNPKTAKLELMGKGTRNDIIATPVIYDGLVYVATGQDPEHGEGVGGLWCIDPNKRGDVSPELVFNAADPSKPIPYKRVQAAVPEEGDIVRPNPNSAVVWYYDQIDADGDGDIAFEEVMHRSIGTVAIKDDILYIADYSGLFHCLNAKTGKRNWVYDMLSASWGSPLIVDDKVYMGDEDGEVAVFRHSADPNVAMQEDGGSLEPYYGTRSMGNSVYSTPIVADNVLYISNRSHLFAITPDGK